MKFGIFSLDIYTSKNVSYELAQSFQYGQQVLQLKYDISSGRLWRKKLGETCFQIHLVIILSPKKWDLQNSHKPAN
jgi:hypothetical protein